MKLTKQELKALDRLLIEIFKEDRVSGIVNKILLVNFYELNQISNKVKEELAIRERE